MKLLQFVFLLALSSSVVLSEDPHPCSHVMKDKNHAVCTLFPESTEGPYYLPDQEVRQDITEGKPGFPLELTMIVVNFTTCEPLVNVAVDLWHCDAGGEYSAFQDGGNPGTGRPPTPPNDDTFEENSPKDENTFLRGIQFTDQEGRVTFKTIFPGWYVGRTVHLHIDAHVNNEKHTGQLYFGEPLTAYIGTQYPYSNFTHPRTTNVQDRIFNEADGKATTLILGSSEGGYQTSILMGFEK